MDQSESNKSTAKIQQVPLPRRRLTVEFVVGLFTIVTFAAFGYLAMGLGELELGTSDKYTVYAEFDNIAGLKYGASVEIAGVQIGDVTDIKLKDSMAVVTMKIDRGVILNDEDIALVRTKGIIGDRYIKISRGASTTRIPEDGMMTETESVVDFEEIVGKIVHSLSNDDEKKDENDKEK
jgi:phospholipid/cholesterol/gamma-HCH transport system substrate-binding protein